MKLLGSFRFFAVILIVLGVVVVLTASHRPVATQRIAHLESLVRCPACDDLSVAQSNAPSSIAVRHEITDRVHEGQSDSQILTAIEGQYGPAILLSPDAGGWGDILWITPLLVVAIGVSLGVRLARRKA